MELSSTIFAETFGPLACLGQSNEHSTGSGETPSVPDWDSSFLNPKSRIDSLVPRSRPTWTLHGIDVDGARFFAVPNFALNGPPMRVDVFIPPVEEHPRILRHVLQSEAALYVKGSNAINLPISQHVLRALQHWSAGVEAFQSQYCSMPYGSKILISNIAASLEDMDIQLAQSYDAEQAMFSVPELKRMWNLPNDSWPEVIDVGKLQLQWQLNEAISIVRIKSMHGAGELAFKSLLRDQRYMYNELKVLLTLGAHPNIMPRPLFIVTKKSCFGSKHGLCGFILRYFPAGSLKQRLTDASTGAASLVTIQEGLRWSIEVTQALMSVNSRPSGFYPDLKPDNIVLRREVGDEPPGQHVVLLDFEQRGGWFSWSPPEIAYLEYLEVLASADSTEVQSEAMELLQSQIPKWQTSSQMDRYKNIDGGFSAPWLALLDRRQSGGCLGSMLEKAQVFMLGKLLWCIFDCEPMVRCGLDRELMQENLCDSSQPLAFPEFRRTPEELRGLIRACTAGAPEWEGRRRALVLRRGKLVPAEKWEGKTPMREDVRRIVMDWWGAELERSRQFLSNVLDQEGMARSGSPGDLLGVVMGRPGFSDVLRELQRLE